MTSHDDWAWWRDRRLPAEVLHLDSAAAGRSSAATQAAVAGYAERETVRGAYVAQAEAAPVLDAGRAELARLLGVPPAGLAFTESAESALRALLDAWPLCPGDTVAAQPWPSAAEASPAGQSHTVNTDITRHLSHTRRAIRRYSNGYPGVLCHPGVL